MTFRAPAVELSSRRRFHAGRSRHRATFHAPETKTAHIHRWLIIVTLKMRNAPNVLF